MLALSKLSTGLGEEKKKKKFKKVKTKNKIKKITESPTETKILLLSALNCLNKD